MNTEALPSGWPSKSELLKFPRQLDDRSAELLATEFEHIGASMLSSEEAGETRVNVFFGVVGAATLGLGFAADAFEAEPDELKWPVAVTTILLLLFGLATLRRVMERNLATTNYLNGLGLIRASHIIRDPDVMGFMPFVPTTTRVRQKKGWGLGKAGFLETVALANSMLAGMTGIAITLAVQQSAVLAAALGLAVSLIAWTLQLAWAKRVYRDETAREAGDRLKALADWRRALRPNAAQEAQGDVL
jgi:hypothetical protein